MPLTVEMHDEKFVKFIQLQDLFNDPQNKFIAETVNGVKKDQVVPFIYLDKNCIDELTGGIMVPKSKVKFTEADNLIEDSLVYPGISLKIFSFQDKIVLMLEEANSILNRQFNPVNCRYYLFHEIKRCDIISYKKFPPSQFYGVKAKHSIQIGANSAIAARGIIGMAIHRGLTKGVSKLEDDIILISGFKYELKYTFNNKVEHILVLCDSAYSIVFDNFLSNNWKTDQPTVPELQKTSNCFIATATFGDYDHPVVLRLRQFRDQVLGNRKLGRSFIDFYYRKSPKYANTISKDKILRGLAFLFVIMPLYLFTFLFMLDDKNDVN